MPLSSSGTERERDDLLAHARPSTVYVTARVVSQVDGHRADLAALHRGGSERPAEPRHRGFDEVSADVARRRAAGSSSELVMSDAVVPARLPSGP
jgi:hypothetical protein